MPRLSFVAALGALTFTITACGKKGGGGGGTALEGPPGLEAAHVTTASGTVDLPKLLVDLAAMQAKVRAAVAPDAPPEASAAGPALLTTAEGWAAAGLDPKGGLVFAIDDRLKADERPLPILITRVSDVDKLVATMKTMGGRVSLGAKTGAVTPILDGDETVALMGAYGDRTAFVVTPRSDDKTAAFEAFLAGKGAGLTEADAFKRAMEAGPSGAGVYFWLNDLSYLEDAGRVFDMSRRERRAFAASLGAQVRAIGLRVGEDGLSLRVVPQDAMADAYAKIYAGNASPKDIGRVIPAKGWAAGRVSLDLGAALGALGSVGLPEGAIQGALGRLGLSLDQITEALSGEIGVGIDLTSLVATFDGRGLPTSINVLGVRDGAKADALVDQVAALVSPALDLKRRDITVGGHKAIVLGNDFFAFVVARVDDLLLITQGEPTMAAAIARMREDNLAGTSAGEVLRERHAFAAVADVGPLLAWLDGASEGGRRKAESLRGIRAAVPEALRNNPIVTVRIGYDGHAQHTIVSDQGLSYGLGLAGYTMAVLAMRPHKVEEPSESPGSTRDGLTGPTAVVVEGALPPACERFLAAYERCSEEMPEEMRGPTRDAIKQVRESWHKAGAESGILESSCQQAMSSMKSAAGAMCPKVVWE